MAREKKSIKQTVQKEMPEFASEVDSLGLEDLECRLSKLTKDYEVTDEAQKADEALSSAQEMVKDVRAPYLDAKKAIRLKTKYVIATIRDKGGDV